MTLDEQDLAADIEESIAGDANFQDALQAVYNGLHADGQPHPTTRGVGTSVSAKSLVSKEAADILFESVPNTTKGFGPIAWFKVAKAVASIVIRVIRRFRKGRAHGMYVTLVRKSCASSISTKIGRIGCGQNEDGHRRRFQGWRGVWWHSPACGTEDPAGRHGDATQNHADRPHTGAIYICNFLKAAAQRAPKLQCDVIFEASNT